MLARIAEESEAPSYEHDRAPRRGKLHVYLGAAPGVGKTYAMLLEGRRLRAAGVDVVCGFIETHGRAETAAQIGDLEVVPRRQIHYRGVIIEEMDTEAIVTRAPRVCLVDEIAHTNAPGSEREKRWQDVEVLRAAGIAVLATLNIQHLESLNDVVEAITGIAVRETVPDHVLEDPTTVSLVDLHPDALRERLREGKIYPGERARQAMENYFRTGNLTALREIALRRVAAGVESSLEQYMASHDIAGPWAATETVMACFGSGPLSGQVLRHAWRLARGLDASYLAVHATRVPFDEIPEAERRILERDMELAEDLGAEVVIAAGPDLVASILRVARERNATQIVIGHSTRSRWQELRGKSLVNELIRRARGYDIHVVADRARASDE
jgi:two-component system sensor histidine kinase KdpD